MTEPNLDKCDCICHSPAFYAPHKTGHACCDDANVIEDNSLLVRTTNIAEHNLDEQIDNIILENLVLANDNGQPYIQYTDIATDKIVALIANQVREARIEAFDVAFDCHDYDKLRAYRAELLKEVK